MDGHWNHLFTSKKRQTNTKSMLPLCIQSVFTLWSYQQSWQILYPCIGQSFSTNSNGSSPIIKGKQIAQPFQYNQMGNTKATTVLVKASKEESQINTFEPSIPRINLAKAEKWLETKMNCWPGGKILNTQPSPVRWDLGKLLVVLLCITKTARWGVVVISLVPNYTFKGTSPHPTKLEKENHRLKSADWEGIWGDMVRLTFKIQTPVTVYRYLLECKKQLYPKSPELWARNGRAASILIHQVPVIWEVFWEVLLCSTC